MSPRFEVFGHTLKERARQTVVGEELGFTKIGIVLVIFAAVALKAERLKIVEASHASLAAWNYVVDLERDLSFAVAPRSKQTIRSPNTTPVLLAPITGSN
jgi:hypothetical protein